MDIQPIISQGLSNLAAPGTETGAGDASFTQSLKDAVQKVNELQSQANDAVKGLVAGENSLHEAVIAMQKADINFEMMMQVRNKIIDAYGEIKQMSI